MTGRTGRSGRRLTARGIRNEWVSIRRRTVQYDYFHRDCCGRYLFFAIDQSIEKLLLQAMSI